MLKFSMPETNPNDGNTVSSQPTRSKNHCFACGQDNPQGMHLKFHLDETIRRAICKFKLSRFYQGPPGHAHGGIIATILDEAMGKVNKLHNVAALTKNMQIEYVRPVPLDRELTVTGWEREVSGRQHINAAEICNEEGEVLARSTGTFIAVDRRIFTRLQKSSGEDS